MSTNRPSVAEYRMHGPANHGSARGSTRTAPNRGTAVVLVRSRHPSTVARERERRGERGLKIRNTPLCSGHRRMPSMPLWECRVEIIDLDELLLATEKVKCL